MPFLNIDRAGIERRSRDVFRLLVGFMYFQFGLLKFFPDLSPAEMIAEYTLGQLSGFTLETRTALTLLATLECAIGVGLMTCLFPRLIFFLLNFHIIGTFMPLFLLPEFCFKFFPFAPTFEGQYIIKNLPLFAAAWILILPIAFPLREEDSQAVSPGND